MATITTGATPLALPGGRQALDELAPPSAPLTDVEKKMNFKPRKPPKIKKHAFGPTQPGAAFRK
jgi:hypothetical protein